MNIPVLVEPLPGGGFRARAGSPFDWTADGATAEAAVEGLHSKAGEQLAAGAIITEMTPVRMKGDVEFGPGSLDMNHPMTKLYFEEIRKNREASKRPKKRAEP